jgi:ABC-type multidrug transport system fused ATPase/permease subunit
MATQQKILDALKASYQDSIILLVSHRVTMFSSFDGVLFMEDKGKALFGTHEELIRKSSTYHDLVALQEGETDDEK